MKKICSKYYSIYIKIYDGHKYEESILMAEFETIVCDYYIQEILTFFNKAFTITFKSLSQKDENVYQKM